MTEHKDAMTPGQVAADVVKKLREIRRDWMGLGTIGEPICQKAADMIEAQAAELTALRAERDAALAQIDENINRLKAMEPKIDALVASNASALERVGALESALTFYGDVSKYPAPLTGGLGDLWQDCGNTARATLANKGADE